MSDLPGRTTIVVGASRGLGRGIATALAQAGAPVIAVSRTQATFPQPADGAGSIQPELADATDATVAASLLDRYQPARAARRSRSRAPCQEPIRANPRTRKKEDDHG
jgi:3-oxoacyl-[acyl-carrier protein] reductase